MRADWPFAALSFESIEDHTLGVALVFDAGELAESIALERDAEIADALEWYQRVDAELADAASEIAILTSLAVPQFRSLVADRQPLRAFVAEMIDALLALDAVAPAMPPRVELAAQFGTDHCSVAHLFPLTVELEMRRPARPDDPDADGWLVSTSIPASTRESFATQFESTDFPEWQLAFVVTTSGRAYWCVDDAAMRLIVGITPEIDGVPQPYFYAPRPIALQLVSFPELLVPRLGNRPPVGERAFATLFAADMDVDVCARRCLELIERLLGWKLAGPARALPSTSANAWMDGIVAAKHSIAVSMSALLTPTLEMHVGKGDTSELRRIFFDRLRSDLRSAYAIGAVVQYPIGRVVLSGVESAPLAFGQVTGVGASAGSDAASAPYVLSTAAVALFATNPSLTFLLELSGDEPSPASIDLDLRYRIGFVAPHGTGSAPWLQLVTPVTRSLGRATIPIPRRDHPLPPAPIDQHIDLPPIGKASVLEQLFDARRWNYAFAYRRSDVPQDNQLAAAVHYGGATEHADVAPTAVPASHDDALAEALVAFELVRAALSERLDRLPLVDAATPAADLDAIAAALELMHFCVLRVAAAFQAHVEPDREVTEPAPRPHGDTLDVIDVIGGELIARRAGGSDSVAESVGISSESIEGRAHHVVTLSGLDILQFQSARASLTQFRNRNLVGSPGRYETSKAFVYNSRPTMFPSSAVASRWVGEDVFDLGGLVPAPRIAARVLPALLGTFFLRLDGTPSPASLVCCFSLSCSYEYEIIPAQDGAPPFVTQLPILQILAVHLRRSETQGFGQEIASRIDAWIADRDASRARARLLFELKYLPPAEAGEGDTIALQLHNLVLAL